MADDPSWLIGELARENAWLAYWCLLEGQEVDEEAQLAVERATIEALTSPRRAVRLRAVQALSGMANPRTVEPLITALGDEDEAVARVAQQALVRMGGEGAVEGLVTALANPIKRVRSRAASTLDTMGDFRVDERWGDLLITALGDEDEAVVSVAQRALIRIGEAVVGRLVEVFVSERGSKRRRVAKILQAVSGFPADIAQVEGFAEALADHDETVAAVAQQALVRMGEAVTDSLLSVISTQTTPLRMRLRAGNALGQVGDPRFEGHCLEPELITVPGGEFWMGSQAFDREKPVHRVHVAPFQIAKYPVTNIQFKCFVDGGGYDQEKYWTEAGWAWRQRQNDLEELISPVRGEVGQFPPERANHPVVNITWYEAVAYTCWLAEVTGKPYRLPTEAQWEKAARGDKDKREYPWGDEFDPGKANLNIEGEKVGGTSPVGIYPAGASPYGIMEMSGNVAEWCSSLLWDYPYDPDDGREDLEAEGRRVLRGGCWLYSDERSARCAHRGTCPPSHFSDNFGLRLVVGFAHSLSRS